MARTLALIFAATVACCASPQIAAASCSGSACPSYSLSGDKFTNKDKDLKIRITGCVLKDGRCSGSDFDITIDPNASKAVPGASGSSVKIDVKTAAFVGALTRPHVATLPSTNSVMTTINNQTDVTVTVKYQDVEHSEFSKEVKERSSSSVAIRMDPNASASQIKWTAYAGSKMCDSGAATGSSSSGTIDVTKCKKSCELSMDKANCELKRDMTDTEQTRKHRDQARADLAKARDAFNACVTKAKATPTSSPTSNVCASERDKVNDLIGKITADDQRLGETEPGAPLRREEVLNLPPIPAKPNDTKKIDLRGCEPTGSPDAPKDLQGNTGGVMDGHSAGCKFPTNVGGGRK